MKDRKDYYRKNREKIIEYNKNRYNEKVKYINSLNKEIIDLQEELAILKSKNREKIEKKLIININFNNENNLEYELIEKRT